MKKIATLIPILFLLLPVNVFSQDFWINDFEPRCSDEQIHHYKIYYYHDNEFSGRDFLTFSPGGYFSTSDRVSYSQSQGSYEKNGVFFSAIATSTDGLDILLFYEGFIFEPFIFGISWSILWEEEQPSRHFFGMRTSPERKY